MNSMIQAQHLILYDGICGLCIRLNLFIIQRDKQVKFAFASIQGAYGTRLLAMHGLRTDTLTTFYLVEHFRSDRAALSSRADAALRVASHLGWPWKAAKLFRIFPKSMLNWLYDLVARHRYRFFGRSESCFVPGAEYRDRFLGEGDE